MRYRLQTVVAAQTNGQGDLIETLGCSHRQLTLGGLSEAITEADISAHIGRCRHCLMCGDWYGPAPQGFMVRDQGTCGGLTFIDAQEGGTRPCTRCRRRLDISSLRKRLDLSATSPSP